MLIDADMNLIASATILLPSNSNDGNNTDEISNGKVYTLSAPLDNSHGRVRLVYSM